jgi:hypothetical protein
VRKADETLRNKLLALIKAFPGIEPANIPKSQLRFLRPLEQEGKIECLSQGDTHRWYIAGQAPSPIQKEESTQEKSIPDRLYDLFVEQFGEDWRREITLTLRADNLYWLVRLAQWGIDARREHFKSDASTRPAEAAASLASWSMDLQNLVDRIKRTFPPKKGGKS